MSQLQCGLSNVRSDGYSRISVRTLFAALWSGGEVGFHGLIDVGAYDHELKFSIRILINYTS